jgi:hypothetical protein
MLPKCKCREYFPGQWLVDYSCGDLYPKYFVAVDGAKGVADLLCRGYYIHRIQVTEKYEYLTDRYHVVSPFPVPSLKGRI